MHEEDVAQISRPMKNRQRSRSQDQIRRLITIVTCGKKASVTSTLTTCKILLNFKVEVMWVLGVFFCLRDAAAATRGQYLALSKAWRSCLLSDCHDVRYQN